MGRVFAGSCKKKLKEAARHWLRGGASKFDDDDAAMLGAQEEETAFSIHPKNWDAMTIFCAASTQWKWLALAETSVRVGLVYSEVLGLMTMYNVTDKKDCFERVRIMESEVLDVARAS